MASFIISFFSSSGTGKGFIKYENSDYNYRIIIPGAWKKTVTSDKSKHVLLLTNKFDTSVKIEVLKSGDDIEKIIHEKKWCLRQVDARVQSIIETPTVTLKDNASGKLLVFEYFTNRSTFLHRAFISKNGGMIYIVDCKSPLWNFYRVEDIFNTALASFGYLSAQKAEEASEEKAEPKTEKQEVISSKKAGDEELEDEGSDSGESADDESLDEEEE